MRVSPGYPLCPPFLSLDTPETTGYVHLTHQQPLRISPSRPSPRFSGVARAASAISPTSPRVAHTRPVSIPDVLYCSSAPLIVPSSSGWAKIPNSRFVDMDYPVLSLFCNSRYYATVTSQEISCQLDGISNLSFRNRTSICNINLSFL